ncbi:NUDIX hydrolase [Chlorella sorokiniana]|uniref:NUDIX hydrolase n=1 Tax=Chlorella sorokiniana TaxID=3076 RepID=A0A2P6TRY9_CHLSO|nr:NUDIX hydrolase [Chlorella sorokiniana]|eukprot:PRW56828.1 NUDIX hydrolase [Chlorella sorokiniana]
MPPGRPVADFSVKSAPPTIRLLVRGTMFGALACFFLLPWAAMALSSSWAAGLTYFLPSMALTVANIVVEQRTWRAGKLLAVYALTPANNLIRLVVSAAGLWDMSLLTAVRGAAVHWSLPVMAGAQAAFSAAVMLSVVPAVVSQLPVRSAEAEP